MSGPLALVAPVLAQVLLTLLLLALLGARRAAAARGGHPLTPDMALSGASWPRAARQAANSFSNQFEVPVLFYVLCGVATFLHATGIVSVVLAWAFVASRLVHALVHVTTNRIPYRFTAFAFGVAILVALWVVVAVRLVAGF